MPKAKRHAVYALVGDEPFLQTEALRAVMARLPDGAERIDKEGESAELADVLDELRSLSMFSAAKAVVVRNADEFITRFREKLEDFIAESAEGNAALILRCKSLPKNQRIYKAIQKAGEIVPCEPPKAAGLARWVASRAAEAHDLRVTPEAAELLADLIGADLGRLDNELAKLALQIEGGKPVTPDAIAGTVAFQREQEMWNMTDELSHGDVASALRRWRQLTRLDSSSEFRAVTWLSMWLDKAQRALAMHRQNANPFAIAKTLRIWPADNVKPLLQIVQKIGDGGLARAVDRLAEIDKQNKSGVGDPASNVERFLLTLN